MTNDDRRLPWRAATAVLVVSLGLFPAGWWLVLSDSAPAVGALLGIAGLIGVVGSAFWLALLAQYVLERRARER